MSAGDDVRLDEWAAERMNRTAGWLDEVVAVVREQNPGQWDFPSGRRRLQQTAYMLADLLELDHTQLTSTPLTRSRSSIVRLAAFADESRRRRAR